MSDQIRVRSKQVNPYFQVHHDLFAEKHDISVYGIAVYVILCKIENQQKCSKEKWIPKNRAYVAKLARISTGSVSNAFAELIAAGLIEVDKESEAHPNKPTEYTILAIGEQIQPSPYDGTPSPHDHDPLPPSPHDGHHMTGKERIIRKEERTLSSTSVEDGNETNQNSEEIDDPFSVDDDFSLQVVSKPSKEKKEKASSRASEFKNEFWKYFEDKNHVPPPWDASEATRLKNWLTANPTITLEQWQTIIANRGKSPVTHAKRLRVWLDSALSWLNGPADDFGKSVFIPPPKVKYEVCTWEEAYAAGAKRDAGL